MLDGTSDDFVRVILKQKDSRCRTGTPFLAGIAAEKFGSILTGMRSRNTTKSALGTSRLAAFVVVRCVCIGTGTIRHVHIRSARQLKPPNGRNGRADIAESPSEFTRIGTTSLSIIKIALGMRRIAISAVVPCASTVHGTTLRTLIKSARKRRLQSGTSSHASTAKGHFVFIGIGARNLDIIRSARGTRRIATSAIARCVFIVAGIIRRALTKNAKRSMLRKKSLALNAERNLKSLRVCNSNARKMAGIYRRSAPNASTTLFS